MELNTVQYACILRLSINHSITVDVYEWILNGKTFQNKIVWKKNYMGFNRSTYTSMCIVLRGGKAKQIYFPSHLLPIKTNQNHFQSFYNVL